MSDACFTPQSQYETLKRAVFLFASRQLNADNPRFVQEFQAELLRTSDFQAAYANCEHLLGRSRQSWRDMLTTVFEIEMVGRKTQEALRRMSLAVRAPSGEDFFYHFDHWLFQIDALFDRCERTMKNVARIILAPNDPSFKTWEKTRAAEIDGLRAKISHQRNKLAHGLGGGVDGVSRWWDGYLSIPGLDFTTTGQLADQILQGVSGAPTVATRARWHAGLASETERCLAGIDTICGHIAAAVTGLESPASEAE